VSIKLKVEDYLKEDKPRERFIELGPKALTSSELLAIILRSGSKEKSVFELSNEVVASVDSISDLASISIDKLTAIKGIKEAKAISVLAAVELGRRVFSKNEEVKKMKIINSNLAFELLKDDLMFQKQEIFTVIFLDYQKQFIKKMELFRGTINQSIVHPREIFKYALECSASFIIIAHNHPSDTLIPSKDDINFTKRIIELGKLMQISLIDHLIIGTNKYESLRSNNYIDYW